MTQAFEVLMPSMGEGITEATLVRWLKKSGDSVAKDEPLLEVSTDKVDTEIPAPASGVLVELKAAEGAQITVNSVIAVIGGDSTNAIPSAKPLEKTATKGETTTPKVAPSHLELKSPARPVAANVTLATDTNSMLTRSSPLVRKMAKSQGVDLSQLTGSGLHGRITKRDLEAFDGGSQISQIAKSSAPIKQSGAAHLENGSVETKKSGAVETLDGVVVRRETMSRMRALIADHMVRSVRTSPHVTTVFELDLHRVVTLREKQKTAFAKNEGFNLTFTPFFIQAAVHALKTHPICNVSVDGNDILWKDSINIGCAVAIETGLIVPVIKNAGELNFVGIARRLNDIVVRARSKKLTPEDVQGGTFSITNPGMYGSIVSAPIINQPQVAILSIGQIVKRPVVIDDMIAIRPLMQVGLTFDHRVIDGEGGAKFLATYKKFLESYDESIS